MSKSASTEHGQDAVRQATSNRLTALLVTSIQTLGAQGTPGAFIVMRRPVARYWAWVHPVHYTFV